MSVLGLHRPATWIARSTSALSVGTALAITSGLVWQASYSSFASTTVNTGDSRSTGTVLLDDNASTAAFDADDLAPGATGTRCIAVTSTGSAASAVKLYGTGYTTTHGLGRALNLTITQGTGASDSSCTGFAPDDVHSAVFAGSLAAFSAATGYGSGLGSWTPAGGATATKVYRLVYAVDADAASTVQGGTAAIGFTWEAHATDS